MLITGLDTETTGLDAAEGHRIIEVGCPTYDSITRNLVDRYVQRIDPERAITPKAQEVHGIAYNVLVEQPKWDSVTPEVQKRLAAADMMVSHNAAFDVPIVGTELIHIGMTLPVLKAFCTMENGRCACADGKFSKLQRPCFALDVHCDPAASHAVDYDVTVMKQCFFWRGLDCRFYVPPMPITLLQAA